MPELLHAPEPHVAAPSRAAVQPARQPPEHDPFADAQRGVGNQGLQQLLRSFGAQAQLTVSEPGDPLEEEADRVADDVLRTDDSSGVPVLRLCEDCEEEDQLQRQAAPKKEEEEDEKKLRVQPKAKGAPPAVSPQITQGISAARAGGVPLPSSERSFFEPRFGRDLADVRVHSDAAAARSARSVNAHAYTVGSDVVFAPGQYAPRTAQGRRLLAHELAHVAQQQPRRGVARSPALVARQAATATAPAAAPAPPTTVTTPTAATPGTVPAPQNRAETPPVPPGVPVEEVTLQAPTFTPPATVDSYLEERGNAGGLVRARFGNIAAGTINVRKRGASYETHGGRYSSIPLVHPALADLAGTPAQPVLAVRIEDSRIEGFVSLAALERRALQRDALLNFIEEHPEAMRWVGLTDLRFPAVTNKLEGGNLQLKVDKFSFKLGGYLRGTGTFGLNNESVVFNAQTHIRVPRLAEADLDIERDVTGGIKGRVEIPVRIQNFQGNLIAAYENGTVDIQGRVRYTTKKLTGEVTLLVTDEETARNVARRRLPPDQIRGTAQEAAAPAGAPVLARPGPRALAGWGDLDFHFTPWLTGKATVIIDGEGHVTVVGEIAPPLRIELFPQKDFVKRVFTLEARALYGVPVVGNIFVFANVSIDALAKFGPGTLYNMRIEGTYSTDPAVLDRFSISATMNISAFAGLRLRGEGGAGVEILEHDIKAGVGVWALAGIRGYVEATPTIGYRELAEPVAGEEGQFYIHGHMELAAQPFLGLGGDLFVELDSPWWSPAPDKKWTWPLGQLEYPLPGAFGIGADVDYVVGSEELPEIQFTDVDFNAQKFMTDLMNDKVPPREVPPEQEQPGQWNEGEAPADAAATQGEPGATDTQGAPPEGEAASGQQDPAAEGQPPSPETLERWQGGMQALKEIVERSQREPYTEQTLNQALDDVRTEYEFTALTAEHSGEDWKVHAEMNPKGDFKVEGATDVLPGSPEDFVDATVWEDAGGRIAAHETEHPQPKLTERSESFSLKVMLEYINRSPATQAEKDEARDEVLRRVREAMAATNGDTIYYRLRDAARAVNELYPPEAEVQLQVHHEERVSEHPATFTGTRAQRIRQREARRIDNQVRNLTEEERAIAAIVDPEERRRLIGQLADRLLEQDIEDSPAPLDEVEMDVMPREAHLGRVHGHYEQE